MIFPPTALFHQKTKPQNSNCKAASAALSGFAFHQEVPGWRSHESPGGAFDRPNRSALCADAVRRFRAARLQPSALHLPPCSDFAMLRSSCRTFVSLCHSRFGKNPAKHRPSGRGPVPFAWARAHLAMFRRRKEAFPDKARRAAFPVRQKMSAVIFRTSGKFLPGHYTGLCQPLFRQSHCSGQVHHAWEQTYGRHNGQDGFHPCGTAVSADQELPAEISG